MTNESLLNSHVGIDRGNGSTTKLIERILCDIRNVLTTLRKWSNQTVADDSQNQHIWSTSNKKEMRHEVKDIDPADMMHDVRRNDVGCKTHAVRRVAAMT